MTAREWKVIRAFMVVILITMGSLVGMFVLAIIGGTREKQASVARIQAQQAQNKAQMNMIMQAFGQVIESLKKVEGKALLSEQDRATIHKQLNELKAKL